MFAVTPQDQPTSFVPVFGYSVNKLRKRHMDNGQRILIGAIGGLTPYLITLLSIDFKSVVVSYELLDWIGMVIRCLVLIFLGALVAFLHKSETEQFKVFQLGLAAPALLATFINGNPGNNESLPAVIADRSSYTVSIISSAFAADDVKYVNEGMLREPKVSSTSRFFRGLLGTKLEISEDETYFVIVGSHLELESAEKQVTSLAGKDYKAKVYNPYINSKYYAVVIASNVTKSEAVKIKDSSIEDGLPSDSYIWTY